MSQMTTETWQDTPGDMSADLFRAYGHEVVDWIADYLDHPEGYPVLSRVQPGAIENTLPGHAPDNGEPFSDILRDFQEVILPGITHWNHPSFFAYFAISGSAPGILGEMLSAALNVNSMLWRTSPAATELETVTLNWLRQLVGLPESFEGVVYDTASISTLVAIAAAREALGHEIREKGMAGRADLPPLTLYCSEQSHSSIEKDAITLGIGQEYVRKIPTDPEFRMDTAALRQAVQADLAAARKPFCVVVAVGTTSTTSVDPVPAIADVAAEYGMWLHVDAAYAGAAAVLPEMHWLMDGMDRADSVVINPHKWLFTPVDLSAFFSPRLDVVRDAFSLVPEYLRTSESDEVRNYMDYGPQLGRRFRALKLWFVLRTYGREGIAVRLREHIRLAQNLARWIDDDPEWERLAPAPFSTVCFRAHPASMDESRLDALNQCVMDRVNATGKAFLSHTRLRGKLTLRAAIGHIRTSEDDVRRLWVLLREALREEQPPGPSLT